MTLVVGPNGLPVQQNKPKEVPAVVVKELPKVACLGCSPVEQKTAEFFYNQGVTDKKALAVVLGNIKQESRFIPNICEGGAIVPYEHCRKGGFGIIQFTSSHRFYGLGNYAKSIGKPPEDFETQLNYVVTEREWIAASKTFKVPGLNISRYDRAAYTWLGYGVAGRRMTYAYQYINRIITT